jgi:hypothetical protein
MNDYTAGATSTVELIFLQDSTKTDGSGKTGLAYNTGGLTCYYKRSNGTTSVAVTLANISTLGTFVSGGFREIDATNMPGCYEFQPPDAAFASGAKEVTFFFAGVTGLAPRPIKFRIPTVNPDSAGFGLSLAKTTNITGFNDIAATAIVSSGAITTSGGKVSGVALVDTLTTYTGNTPQTGDSFTRIGSTGSGLTSLAPAGTALSTATWTTARAGYLDNLNVGGAVASHADASVLSSQIGSPFQSGSYTAPPSTSAIATAVWQDATSGDFTVNGSVGKILATNLDAAVSTRSTYAGGAVASVTGNVGGNVVGSVASVTASVSLNLSQTGLSPRALDSVNDSALTVGDALVAALCAAAGKESVSGTSYVVQTPHTGTTIRTFTLDSGTAPTTRT